MTSSFLPCKQNFPIWKNSTFHYQFQWLNDNGKEKTPQNLTHFTATCPVTNVNEKETYMTLTTENGGIVLSGETGFISIIILDTVTEAIAWEKANYTLYVIETEAPKQKLPLLTGRFYVAGPPR